MPKIQLTRAPRRSAVINILFVLSMFLAGSAHAVLLGLVPDAVPDAKSRNTINYYFTNGTNSSGGFTMDIDGIITSVVDNTGTHNVSGSCYGIGCYSLTASFNSAGVFVSGTISLTGTAPTSSPLMNSGTFVTGTLTDFGWGGSDESGIFEYTYDLTGGDFSNVWGASNGGTVIDTRELAFGAGLLGTCDDFDQTDCYNLGDWDASGLMTQEFSTAQPPGIFLSGATTGDTFIPVPAAVWLFGSAIGFLSFLRRRAVPFSLSRRKIIRIISKERQ